MPGIQISELANLKTQLLRADLLRTSITLGILERLQTPTSAQQLSHQLKLSPHQTTLLLNALSGQGWVTQEGEHFHTIIPTELLDYITEQLRTPNLLNDLNSAPATPDFAHQARVNWPLVYGIRGRYTVELVRTLFPSQQPLNILDLGCGCGGIGIAIAEAFPHSTLTLVETPEVLPVTKSFAAGSTATQRIHTDTTWHGHYNLIIASGIFYFADNLNAMVKRVAQALSPGGHLLHTHRPISADATQPADFILHWLPTQLRSQHNYLFTEAELTAAFRAAALVPTGHRGEGPFPLEDLVISDSLL